MAAPIPASHSGVVTRVFHDIDDVVQVGAALFEIDSPDFDDDQAAPVDEAPAHAQVDAAVPQTPVEMNSGKAGRSVGGKVLATPAVRGRARERGIDLSKLVGSGLNGRILDADFD